MAAPADVPGEWEAGAPNAPGGWNARAGNVWSYVLLCCRPLARRRLKASANLLSVFTAAELASHADVAPRIAAIYLRRMAESAKSH